MNWAKIDREVRSMSEYKAENTDLPEGFKMTELGPLPQEWQVVRLGEVVEASFSGGTPSTNIPSYWGGNIAWTTSAVIGEDDILLTRYQRTITQEGLENSSSKVAPKGSLIVGTRVGVGKAVVATSDIAMSQDLTALILSQQMDPVFLAYYFKASPLQKQIQDRTRGTTIRGIPRGDLLGVIVALPPAQEQKAIAYVLRTVQRAKETTERVIAATQELKKSLMRHLFTYGRVPIDQADQVRLKETEIGPVPEHWDVVRLGEVGQVITGRTPPTAHAEYWNGGIPFITPVDLKGGPIHRAERSITEQGLTKARPLPKGAVLVSCIGYIGKIGVVDAELAVTNQQINAVLCQNAYNWFLAYALMQEVGVLEARARMTTVPILHKANFERMPIPLPPLPEQQAIAEILRAVDRKIQAEERRKAALDALFKTLLQHLMTGKVRVAPGFVQQFNREFSHE